MHTLAGETGWRFYNHNNQNNIRELNILMHMEITSTSLFQNKSSKNMVCNLFVLFHMQRYKTAKIVYIFCVMFKRCFAFMFALIKCPHLAIFIKFIFRWRHLFSLVKWKMCFFFFVTNYQLVCRDVYIHQNERLGLQFFEYVGQLDFICLQFCNGFNSSDENTKLQPYTLS